jgi:hypothetical protein
LSFLLLPFVFCVCRQLNEKKLFCGNGDHVFPLSGLPVAVRIAWIPPPPPPPRPFSLLCSF